MYYVFVVVGECCFVYVVVDCIGFVLICYVELCGDCCLYVVVYVGYCFVQLGQFVVVVQVEVLVQFVFGYVFGQVYCLGQWVGQVVFDQYGGCNVNQQCYIVEYQQLQQGVFIQLDCFGGGFVVLCFFVGYVIGQSFVLVVGCILYCVKC